MQPSSIQIDSVLDRILPSNIQIDSVLDRFPPTGSVSVVKLVLDPLLSSDFFE